MGEEGRRPLVSACACLSEDVYLFEDSSCAEQSFLQNMYLRTIVVGRVCVCMYVCVCACVCVCVCVYVCVCESSH